MTPAHWFFYILGVVVAFLLLGFASPKRFQVKAQRRLPAPPPRVWRFLAEPGRLAAWYPHVVDCVPLQGDGTASGDRRRVRLVRRGRQGEPEEVVTRIEPGQRIGFEHSRERWEGRLALWKEGRLDLRLDAAEGGATLSASYWFDGAGYLGRMFCLLFLRKRHESDLRQGLATLERRLVEEPA